MKDLRAIRIPKIADGVEFEYLCRDIWKNDTSNNELVAFNGRPGQAQDGVDVFGRNISKQKWFAIQCKARKESNSLSQKEIETEIKKALYFNPKLKHYILATTLPRDVGLQKISREINEQLSKDQHFTFEIIFWNEIEDILKEEKNINIYHKYYQQFFANNETLGHAIGKLINLELGISDYSDTHYEIMLGKIPKKEEDTSHSVNYYKGSYFIINFHERKMETFSLPCYPSDLEEVCFGNTFDRFRISKWINSIKNMDKFIYQTEDTINSYISESEYSEYLDELKEDD